tara:strand:+ start:952 stop:1533 length:582 start_codon:yes stop_codon:yes gene_type:complete
VVSKVKRKYAKGANAKAIDDRTGFKVNLSDMRKEWNGLMVHKDEWEPKHPQLRPRSAIDAQQLRNARPDTSTEIVRVESTHKLNVQAIFNVGQVSVTLSAVPSGVATTLSVGAESLSVDINLSVTGVAGTGSVGNISSGIILAGVATTLSVGNEIPVSAVLETGVAITSAVGTVTIKEDFWGSAAWGSGTWGN